MMLIPHPSSLSSVSRRRILLHHLLHPLLIRRPILLIQIIRIRLRGRLRVYLVQQHLDPQEDLFDGDGGFPALFFVEDAEADGAGGVDVGVEEWGDKFA